MLQHIKRLLASTFSANTAQRRDSAICTLEPLVLMSGSTIEIFASGDEGFETLELQIDGVAVETFENVSTDGDIFSFETDSLVDASRIRVAFVNDVFDLANGIDSNLTVDRIVVDGETFETEAPTTFATGVYTEAGFEPDFHQTETLQGNGFFQFEADPALGEDVEIEVVARGTEGDELLVVQTADGEDLASFIVTSSLETYTFTTDQFILGDNIRVSFLNDLYDPVNGIDRNLIVDRIAINGFSIETDDFDAVSVGTFVPDVDFDVSVQEDEILLDNSFFEYRTSQATSPSVSENSTLIEINARGDEGTERLRVTSNGVLLGEFDVTTAIDSYIIETTEYTAGAAIQVEFINDFYDPENGIDANLFVESVSVDGEENARPELLLFSSAAEYLFSV